MTVEAKQATKVDLLIVVSGTPIEMNVNVHETLHDLFQPAVKKAGIAGQQSPAEWEFTYNKVVLDQNKPIREFGFPEKAQIFLNKKAGAAG